MEEEGSLIGRILEKIFQFSTSTNLNIAFLRGDGKRERDVCTGSGKIVFWTIRK